MARPVEDRYGSKADVTLLNFDVRFTPESGHPAQTLTHSFNERRFVGQARWRGQQPTTSCASG